MSIGQDFEIVALDFESVLPTSNFKIVASDSEAVLLWIPTKPFQILKAYYKIGNVNSQ